MLQACHGLCNGLCHLQEYLNDYGTEEEKRLGTELLQREAKINLSESAQVRQLERALHGLVCCQLFVTNPTQPNHPQE